jgi:hypothetical protein
MDTRFPGTSTSLWEVQGKTLGLVSSVATLFSTAHSCAIPITVPAMPD